MKRLTILLVLVVMLAACGSEHHAVTRPTKVRPPAARVPEGASGKDKSHFYNEPTPEAMPPAVPAPVEPTTNPKAAHTSSLAGSQIRIDSAGRRLIENFENVYQSVYCPFWDPYGHVWTRAYGETDWGGNFGGRCITHAQADANVGYLVERDYQYAVRGLGVHLSHHQTDALDSFVWNLGPGSMRFSSLRGPLQRHDPYPLLAYDIAGGQVLSALYRRRHQEVAYYLTPDANPSPPSRSELRRRLAHDQAQLVRLRKRKRALLHALVTNHCKPRSRQHKCVVWVGEAAAAHRAGVRLDGQVARLKRQLG